MTDSPTPVKSEERNSFGILWYATEAEADLADSLVRARGTTYNGGFYHGQACGRDPSFDGVAEDGRKIYAVTY